MTGGNAGALVPSMFLGGILDASMYHLCISLGYHTEADVSVIFIAIPAFGLVGIVQVTFVAIVVAKEVFGSIFGSTTIVACVITYKLARR